MDKEDMIILIEAFEAWEALNRVVSELTDGYRIGSEKLCKLDGIYDVIRHNCRYSKEEDDKKLESILLATDKTAEAKYELIRR